MPDQSMSESDYLRPAVVGNLALIYNVFNLCDKMKSLYWGLKLYCRFNKSSLAKESRMSE